MVTSALPQDTGGGAECYAAELARTLSDRHDVSIVTASRQDGPADVPMIRLPPGADFRLDGGLAHKLIWHASHQWRPVIFVATRRALERIAPDVVHTHNMQGMSAAVFSAIRSKHLPHVHTAHDYSLLCARGTMTRGAEPCNGRCAACTLQRFVRRSVVRPHITTLVAPSDRVRQIHVQFGVVPEARATTIRQGAIAGVPRLRGTGPVLRFGYVGSLAQHKGVLTLLDAMRELPGCCQLHIAGNGPLRHMVRQAADADARILYVGYVEGADKDSFLDAVDVLVLPSEWEENAPLVLVEGAIRGIPSIVSDRGGLPETPCAFVTPARDPRALGAVMRALAEDPADVARRSARLLALGDRFEWGRHVSEIELILESAAA